MQAMKNELSLPARRMARFRLGFSCRLPAEHTPAKRKRERVRLSWKIISLLGCPSKKMLQYLPGVLNYHLTSDVVKQADSEVR